jgi:cholesterol 7-dehydrogenase
MHISDMAENAADYYHFNYLHKPLALPVLRRLMHMSYDTKLYFDSEVRQRCFFENLSTVWLMKRWPFRWYTQKTIVTFDGPGLVHFDVKTPLGNIWLLKSVLPVGPFQMYSEDVWFAESRVPRWLVHLIATIARDALEQDRGVWESRLYRAAPHLVKGDGPFLRYRRWFEQFYSESSDQVERRHLSREQQYQW